ncbi:MAG: hypothetical protein Q8Q60_00330 [Candidatus Chromulinivorax sp.]|nr:hypothetical protein [Candidatus Chromulinivorax sp.]
MQNFTLQTHLLLNALLHLPISTPHNWYDHAAEKLKGVHSPISSVTDMKKIVIHQENNLQCQGRIFMHDIYSIVAFDANNLDRTMLISDVTGKSDAEINETAKCLFEKIKSESQEQEK